MSIYGKWTDVTISAGTTTSAAVDVGYDYDRLSLEIPGMDSCKLHLKVSETLGGTYYDLGDDVTTDAENFGRADVWELGGWRYIKIVSSVPQTSTVTIRVRGMRY